MSAQWMVRRVHLTTTTITTETGAYVPWGWEPFAVEEGGHVWLRWKVTPEPAGEPVSNEGGAP